MSSPVKVFSESTAHAVESDGVDAAVGESEAEAQNTEVMPEGIVILLRSWMDVKPQHENVLWEKTHGEHNDKGHHHLSYLFTGLYLLYLECVARAHRRVRT